MTDVRTDVFENDLAVVRLIGDEVTLGFRGPQVRADIHLEDARAVYDLLGELFGEGR